MPAIDIRSLLRLALVGIVAIRIDPRLGLLLITCFVVRGLTAGSETFVAATRMRTGLSPTGASKGSTPAHR
jgi:hypothetical protein